MPIRLLFTNRNTHEEGLRIYRSETPFDQNSLPTVYDELPPGSEVYLDENVVRGQEFYYMVEAYRGTERVYSELLHAYGLPTETGPGPQVLMLGDHKQGFYGEIPANEFITGTDLAGEMGLTAGNVINNDAPWLKFNLDGKTLFYPKLSLRYYISWDNLNNAGLIIGDRTITIDGEIYKVRLLKGMNPNPKPWETIASGNNVHHSLNSEWNRLLYLVVRDDIHIPEDLLNLDAPYTNADLGLSSGNGRNVWCQETRTSSSSQCIYRGSQGVSYFGHSVSSNGNQYWGWRPCLELVS